MGSGPGQGAGRARHRAAAAGTPRQTRTRAQGGAADPSVPSPRLAAQRLLAQRAAISNWAEFAAANSFNGWQAGTDACGRTGVTCGAGGEVQALSLGCDWNKAGPGCGAVEAAGSLAPGLAGITTLQQLHAPSQSLTGALPDAWGAPDAFPSLERM